MAQAKAIQLERSQQPEQSVAPTPQPAMPEQVPESAYGNDGRGAQLPMPEAAPLPEPESATPEMTPEAAAMAWEDRVTDAASAAISGVERVGDMADGALRVAAVGVQVADRLVDMVDGLLDFAAGATPARKISAAEYAADPAARRELHQQQAAQRTAAMERDQALDRMRDDIAAGRNLDANSIRKLNRDDLENIKAKGDDHLRGLIQQREQERGRDYSSGREREHTKGRDWRDR